LVRRHAYRSANDVDAPACERITIIGIASELRWSEVALPASPVGKRATRYLSKKAPQIEVLHALVAVNVVLCGALAQAHETKPIGVSAGVFLASEKVTKVGQGDPRKPAKIAPSDALERSMW